MDAFCKADAEKSAEYLHPSTDAPMALPISSSADTYYVRVGKTTNKRQRVMSPDEKTADCQKTMGGWPAAAAVAASGDACLRRRFRPIA